MRFKRVVDLRERRVSVGEQRDLARALAAQRASLAAQRASLGPKQRRDGKRPQCARALATKQALAGLDLNARLRASMESPVRRVHRRGSWINENPCQSRQPHLCEEEIWCKAHVLEHHELFRRLPAPRAELM